MNSLAIITRGGSKHFGLSVALVLATVLFPRPSSSQQLQQGVSVQLAVTSNAVPMPEADNQDAWIVAISADGSLHFGTVPVSPADLEVAMKGLPRRRDQRLYIKADARTPFANVERVLQLARLVSFEAPVLLTSQPGLLQPGGQAPPKGLEVLVGQSAPEAGPTPPGPDSILVQVLPAKQFSVKLRINNQDIQPGVLQSTLDQMLQSRSNKEVLVKADEKLPFGQVVQAIDACRGAGSKVVLVTPKP
ncbi:MAG: biopolymer transporter ExbD [Candidatus Sulfotelmatobacter sp.]